ncbi:unnamed protein product [Cochlearia groenlandica]
MVKKAKWLKNVKKAFSPDSKKLKYQSGEYQNSEISYPVLVSTSRTYPQQFEVRVDEVNSQHKKMNLCLPKPDPVTATDDDVHVDSPPSAPEFVELPTPDRFVGKSKEDAAAILIQATLRGYLARRELREMKGVARLKLLMEGSVVQRQAANTLKCMQTLTRVQSQILSRRIRMSEENQFRHKQLLHKHAKEQGGLKNGSNWNVSNQSKEQVEAGLLNKYEATMRRERALAYAFTHQQNLKSNTKSTNTMFMDTSNPTWGWCWLERWMADRPWESSEKDLNSNEKSSVKNSTNRVSHGGENTKSSNRKKLNISTKTNTLPPTTSSSSITRNPRKTKPTASSTKSKMTEDTKSSERNHRPSSARSSVSDDESLASLTTRRKVPTKPARSKLKAESSLGVATTTTKEDSLLVEKAPAKKRLSYLGSPAPKPRRSSAPPKVDQGVNKVVAPIIAGVAVAAAAYAGKYGIEAWQAFKARPPRPRFRKFYEGGFQATMTRKEAAMILGVRESVAAEKVKEAHRRVMVANHPDAGGSHYLASKINEAKDMMLGKTKSSGSAF